MVQETLTPIDSKSIPHPVSINALTKTILDRYSSDINSKQIRVETELQPLNARVNQKSITSAVCNLLENAIAATPSGGELSITLVNGENCWELEIADSAKRMVNSRLEDAWLAAKIHGGLVQSLACPQGGNANVLVIPQDKSTGIAK